MNILTIKSLCCTAFLLLLAGCAIQPQLPLPADNPLLPAVQANANAYNGRFVTWGGSIIQTEVKEKVSLITVLAKPLDSYAEPRAVEHSLGRFIAQFDGFRDPALFAEQRSITITGQIVGTKSGKIGEYNYTYPVVQVTQYHLWPVKVRVDVDDLDLWYWYDPWYYPPYMYPGSHFFFYNRF